MQLVSGLTDILYKDKAERHVNRSKKYTQTQTLQIKIRRNIQNEEHKNLQNPTTK